LPVARQFASQAAIDGNVDLPALKQMPHLAMHGMHSDAARDGLIELASIAPAIRTNFMCPPA
jgi:hypothetical protein